MKYQGKLYGRMAGKYVPLEETAEMVDDMRGTLIAIEALLSEPRTGEAGRQGSINMARATLATLP